MVTLPQISSAHVWIVVWVIVGTVLLYGLACFIQALRTPPDAWTETNRTVGFPTKRRR